MFLLYYLLLSVVSCAISWKTTLQSKYLVEIPYASLSLNLIIVIMKCYWDSRNWKTISAMALRGLKAGLWLRFYRKPHTRSHKESRMGTFACDCTPLPEGGTPSLLESSRFGHLNGQLWLVQHNTMPVYYNLALRLFHFHSNLCLRWRAFQS